MYQQPPLPEPSGADLPSPLFLPRPGWGGQIKKWLRQNLYSAIFRGILLGAALLIITSIIRAPDGPTVQEPIPTIDENTVAQVALPGDGLSQLAARALDEWLSRNAAVELDAVQHLYVVDRMTRIAVLVSSRMPPLIHPGEIVRFPSTFIQTAADEAKALTVWQYRAWTRLLP
ncbi:MAG TPA: hypothetical protein VJ553_03695 [Candidatus Paceibacterota bacterium]|nr:hypothetical protein [Candidatus Paceibacterota bacterium]